MSSRLITLVTILSLTVGAVACGSESGEITLSGSSGDSPTTTSKSGTPGTDGDSGKDEDTDSGNGSSGATPTIPGLDDIPGMDSEFGECIQLSAALATITASMAGEVPDGATREELDKVKAALPAQIRKDFETIAKGYAKFADGDIVAAGTYMNSKEFTDASERVTAYTEKVCSAQPGG